MLPVLCVALSAGVLLAFSVAGWAGWLAATLVLGVYAIRRRGFRFRWLLIGAAVWTTLVVAALTGRVQAHHRVILSQLLADMAWCEEQIAEMDQTIATANSARQIQDARSRQQALQLQISTWQSTYAQLLTNLLRTGATG